VLLFLGFRRSKRYMNTTLPLDRRVIQVTRSPRSIPE
jgi:hypothetical protein